MENRYLVVAIVAVLAAAQLGHAEDSEASQCWHCDDATSNEQCQQNGYVETCQDGIMNGCQTSIRVDSNGVQRITKRCKSLPVCLSEVDQFLGSCFGITSPNSICFFCCTWDKCNSCVSEDGMCRGEDDSSEKSTGKSSKKSTGKSKKCSSSKSTGKSSKKSTCKSTGKSAKDCDDEDDEGGKSTGKSSKKSTCKSTGKSAKDCDNEDDEGTVVIQFEDEIDERHHSSEDDEDCDSDYDWTDEDDEGGARGIYAGVVTWVMTFVGYHLIR